MQKVSGVKKIVKKKYFDGKKSTVRWEKKEKFKWWKKKGKLEGFGLITH